MKLPVIKLMQREEELIRTLNLKSRIEAFKHSSQITCKPGCSSCCYRRIDISLLEAIILLAEIKRTGKWRIVRERIKEHPSLKMSLDPETWASLKMMCPVNDSGKCLGYANRPVSCSSRFSRVDAKFCDPHIPESIPDGIFDVTLGVQMLSKYEAAHGVVHKMPIPEALLLAESIFSKEYSTIEEIIEAIKGAR